MAADLGLQLEGFFRGDVDLGDLCGPEAIAADKAAELQDTGFQALSSPCSLIFDSG